MKLTSNTILIIFLFLFLGIAAMFPIGIVAAQVFAPREPSPAVNPQATLEAMVQQTMAALTQTAPTATPIPPTATPIPATNTPLPTATFRPTSTPVSYCDWAYFVADVTVPDGTFFQPGDVFVKTWRLKNRGTCTWTPDYMLVFNGGAQMSSATAVRMPGYVAPGQTVDISVTFTAPDQPGAYFSYWMLRNPSGVLFGAGENANKSIYAEIGVVNRSPSYGTVTGLISYPSEFLPVVTLYFQNVATGEVIQSTYAAGDSQFSVALPYGTYYVYAWAQGYNLEGAFINPDGTLKPFTVNGGQVTSGILITDWRPEHHLPGSSKNGL